jgi:uncharacterized repeat protein (TIGR01451 family)
VVGKRAARVATLVGYLFVAAIGTALAGPGEITLASTSDSGVKANGQSDTVSLSADGTRVAFQSFAYNLDPADTDGTPDVLVKDLVTGEVTLASASDSGIKSDQYSFFPSLSADGTKVAFETDADLDLADTDHISDIYVKDLGTGDITLASASDSGVKANNHSFFSSLSADGTSVAFGTWADNLDPADTDVIADVYVKDVVTGDITLASASDGGVKANGSSGGASLSADGTRVAFSSVADNLDSADTDGISDVYVKDVVTGDITLASTTDGGVKANGSSGGASLSADGTRVAFISNSTNLDSADTDNIPDIYVKDVVTGDITLASATDAGVKANGASFHPSLSGYGTRVAFISTVTNLDPADTDDFEDVYVKDLVTGDLTLASASDSGVKANSPSLHPSLSADGARVAFISYAGNLDPADTDSIGDVYVKEVGQAAFSADLSVSKRDLRDPVRWGTRLVYTVTVHNMGPDQATSVTVSDELPNTVRFVSATSGQGTCSHVGNLLTCELESLASGKSANIRVVIVPKRPGLLRNTIEVTANETDPSLANNGDVETTRVR